MIKSSRWPLLCQLLITGIWLLNLPSNVQTTRWAEFQLESSAFLGVCDRWRAECWCVLPLFLYRHVGSRRWYSRVSNVWESLLLMNQSTLPAHTHTHRRMHCTNQWIIFELTELLYTWAATFAVESISYCFPTNGEFRVEFRCPDALTLAMSQWQDAPIFQAMWNLVLGAASRRNTD